MKQPRALLKYQIHLMQEQLAELVRNGGSNDEKEHLGAEVAELQSHLDRNEFSVPEVNWPIFERRIEILAKRATKLHMPPIIVDRLGEEFITQKRCNSEGHEKDVVVKYINVRVTGQAPKIGGWTFAAVVQHEAGGNILRAVPGFEEALPREFRTSTPDRCDHCRVERYRRDTYILKSDTSQWKQVGRQCLRDFLGHASPEAIAEWAELLANLEGQFGGMEESEFGGSLRSPEYYHMEAFLDLTRAVIRLKGWKSKSQAERDMSYPTVAWVQDILCFRPNRASQDLQELYDAIRNRTEEDRQRDFADTHAALEWARDLAPDVKDDYLWNLRLLAGSEYIQWRSMGLAASMIAAYLRHVDRKIEQAKGRPSEFFGTAGKRSEFLLILEYSKELETHFGVCTMFRFRDPEGNTAIWFASGRPNTLQDDGTYRVAATVKKHEVYNGRKQTMLTRVTVKESL